MPFPIGLRANDGILQVGVPSAISPEAGSFLAFLAESAGEAPMWAAAMIAGR